MRVRDIHDRKVWHVKCRGLYYKVTFKDGDITRPKVAPWRKRDGVEILTYMDLPGTLREKVWKAHEAELLERVLRKAGK